MAKKKTSKKRSFSFESMPRLDLKNKVGVSRVDAAKNMMDKKYISKALWNCLVEDDVEGFKDILKTYLEFINKDEFSKETGISRRTLFRMLSEEGNPTLTNISKIVHRLCA